LLFSYGRNLAKDNIITRLKRNGDGTSSQTSAVGQQPFNAVDCSGSVVMRRGKPLMEVLLIRRRQDGTFYSSNLLRFNMTATTGAWALPGTFAPNGLPPLLTKAFAFKPVGKNNVDPLTPVERELQENLTATFMDNRQHIYTVSCGTRHIRLR
jgi:ADP-ribose pyrophosphatase YjhB (NUDIX family)